MTQLEDQYTLTRMGSFTSPGQAIACAKAYYSEGFFTVLPASQVGRFDGILTTAEVLAENFTEQVVWIWKHLTEVQPLGVTGINIEAAFAGFKLPINRIKGQVCVGFSVPEGKKFLKSVGIDMG